MNEDILHKSIEISDIELIRKMITISGEKLCLFFNIDPNKTKELVNNLVIESKLSGHNNKIYLINFYDNQQVQIGKICLKYSAENINKID